MIKISGTTGIHMNGTAITDASQIDSVIINENGVSLANETQLGLKANTSDLKEIGVGQTWQDVTDSRVSGVTYTNTTGKPIFVTITNSTGTAGFLRVNGVNIARQSGTTTYTSIQAIIQNGATYSLDSGSGIGHWIELR